MKKIKNFLLIILMTTILIILGTNVEASNVIEENVKYYAQNEIQIRILPLMNSAKIATISGELTVIEIMNDWCKVENAEQQGWVRINKLKTAISGKIENIESEVEDEEETITSEPLQSEEEQEPETVETQAPDEPEEKIVELNKIGYVDADGLKVRKEPNTSSEELHSLSRNDKVTITGQIGNWYRIDYDGEEAYVSAKYISDKKTTIETTSRGEISREETKVENTEIKTEEQPKEENKKEQTSNLGQEIVDYAKTYLNYKYVSGGASPSTGFDCSGFTQYVFSHFGITLSRTSSGQNSNGIAVAKSDLQIGGIVIFNGESNKSIGHVGIYIGDNNFIHASNPSDGVKITSLSLDYYRIRYVGARRVI